MGVLGAMKIHVATRLFTATQLSQITKCPLCAKYFVKRYLGGKVKNYKYRLHFCSNLLYSFPYMIPSEVDNTSMSGEASDTLTMSLQIGFIIVKTFQMRKLWLRECSAHPVINL